jgi:ribosomal protein S16
MAVGERRKPYYDMVFAKAKNERHYNTGFYPPDEE